MDRPTFIGKIIKMYPNSFTEQNTKMWIDVYEDILPVNLDFDELFKDLMIVHNSSVAPSVAVLTSIANKQKERINAKNDAAKSLKQIEQWKEEKAEIEKNDRPVTNVLSPMEILKQQNIPFNGLPFNERQINAFRKYIYSIPNHKIQCEMWKQICRMIGGRDELCREMPKVC